MADNIHNSTHLIEAAKAGDLDIITNALAAGANIDHRDGLQRTALMWAAQGLHLKAVRLLMMKGADPALRDGLNSDAADLAGQEYITNEAASRSIRNLITENERYRQRADEMTADAKALARKMAKEFGGRIKQQGMINNHAACTVNANYRGMQCRFFVFAGGFDLWVQNFRFPKPIYLSLNLEGKDNSSADPNGLTPFDELFEDSFHMYYFAKEGNAPGAHQFLGDRQNQADLTKLKLGRFEWMVFSDRQLRLRTQSTHMELIRLRLDAIADIFARTNQALHEPLLPRYAMKIGKAKGIEQPHVFGGLPRTPIQCPECRSPLGRIAAFDTHYEPLQAIKWRGDTIEAAICLECTLPAASSLTSISYAGDAPVVLQPTAQPESESYEPAEVEPLPERPLSLTPTGAKALEAGNRAGGQPGWIQGDDTPACPACAEPMNFLAQFASTEKYMFGADMGIAYVFLCARCQVVATAIQSC